MHVPARFTTPYLAFALLAAALAGPGDASAQAPGPQQSGAQERPAEPDREPASLPVEVGFSGSLLAFEPRLPGVATSVYVSCADGTYIHRELEGVGAALVEVARADGTPVAGPSGGDVRCKYEVYVHPPVDREAMRLAEEKGDFSTIRRLSRIEEEQTVIHRGRFRVAGGAAVAAVPRASDE